jgi:hypothetical protein
MQSLCTLRNRCRQRPRNTRYQADATPYLGRTCTGWIAPASPGALIQSPCRRGPAAQEAGRGIVSLNGFQFWSNFEANGEPNPGIVHAEILQKREVVRGVPDGLGSPLPLAAQSPVNQQAAEGTANIYNLDRNARIGGVQQSCAIKLAFTKLNSFRSDASDRCLRIRPILRAKPQPRMDFRDCG